MTKAATSHISNLEDHLGYHLRSVSNAVSHSFARKLAATEVTVAEWVILREMFGQDNQTSPSAIADLTGLTRGAVSKLIERLLQKGLVERTGSDADRRCQWLSLTDSARKLVPQLAQLADDNDDYFFGVLTSNEQQQLKQLLGKLRVHHQLLTRPVD
jgi:DNA-binding MarR family transcriptional regulator